jgi:hypothetical protein
VLERAAMSFCLRGCTGLLLGGTSYIKGNFGRVFGVSGADEHDRIELRAFDLGRVEYFAEVPPLREPTRSQEVNAKRMRRLASVGTTVGRCGGGVMVGGTVVGE